MWLSRHCSRDLYVIEVSVVRFHVIFLLNINIINQVLFHVGLQLTSINMVHYKLCNTIEKMLIIHLFRKVIETNYYLIIIIIIIIIYYLIVIIIIIFHCQ